MAVGSKELPVIKVFHEPDNSVGEWANHIYVQLSGRVDPDFHIGGTVTVKTPTSQFTGTIWYIYQGSEAYNLYVHPSNIDASDIPDAESGIVLVDETIQEVATSPLIEEQAPNQAPNVVPVTHIDPALQPASMQTVNTSGEQISQPAPTTETKYPVEQLSKDKNQMYVAAGVALLGLLFVIKK